MIRKVDAIWDKNFKSLQEYIDKYHKFPKYAQSYKNIPLGKWLSRQKMDLVHHVLPMEKESKILSLGIDPKTIRVRKFQVQDEKWKLMYLLLLKYIEEYGHLPNDNCEYQETKLGYWTWNQIKFYKNGILPYPRAVQLEKILFGVPTVQDHAWDIKFNQLYQKWKKIEKDSSQSLSQDDLRTYKYLQNRAENIKDEKSKKKRMTRVKSLNMSNFSLNNSRWYSNFKILQDYLGEFGKYPKVNTVYHDVNIGNWLARQRHYVRKGIALNQEQIKCLNNLAWRFFEQPFVKIKKEDEKD